MKTLTDELTSLKQYLLDRNLWITFKLMIIAVSFYYAGINTNYLPFSQYLQLTGILLGLFAVYNIPYVKKQIREFLK